MYDTYTCTVIERLELGHRTEVQNKPLEPIKNFTCESVIFKHFRINKNISGQSFSQNIFHEILFLII